MTEYLTDIELTQDRDVHLDDANDLALVSGVSNLEQSLGIVASDALDDFASNPITGTNVALLEEKLRQALDRDPHVERVTNVTVREFDRRTDTIVVDVTLRENEEFSIEVGA